MLRRMLPLPILGQQFWGPNCIDNSTDPHRGTELSDLNGQFYRFATSCYKPAFDDCDFPAQFYNEEEFYHPISRPAEVETFSAKDEAGFSHRRIVWGRLCPDTTVSEATNRSGSLFVTKGAEIIRSVIRFKPDQDYVHPLFNRKLIEWTSGVVIRDDGIAVDIVAEGSKPVLDSTTVFNFTDDYDIPVTILVNTAYPVTDPVEVVFETGHYRSTFTLAEISALDMSCTPAQRFSSVWKEHRVCGAHLEGQQK